MSPVRITPQMPPVVAGTAGHVDHGKTSLTKLLTGCETDRLREEKERGMSINLGFAPCLLPGNRVVGIIDVPGHIDFIRNMVAGAASMDILILVIAADDGIMPQTIEHMQIIGLFRKPRIIVALTKTDLVDSEMLDLVKEQIRDFLADHGYDQGTVPVIPVSNVTFEGIDEIRKALDAIVSTIEFTEEKRVFRMNIERVFQLKGFGTVVSGIPESGKAEAGDEVEILPLMKKTTIRAVQNYKHGTDRAAAGICSAINLKHANASELERGMTVAMPGVFSASTSALTRIISMDQENPIRNNTEYRFHSGTSETGAKVTILDAGAAGPHAPSIARIRFAKPMVLAAGDKFVIRKISPSITIGGGTVIAPVEMREKKSSGNYMKRLKAADAEVEAGDFFAAELLAGTEWILGHDRLLQMTRLVRPHADTEVIEKTASGMLAEIGGNSFLVKPLLYRIIAEVEKVLKKFHQDNPQLPGIDSDALIRQLGIEWTDSEKFVTLLVADENSPFRVQNRKLALKTFSPRAEHPAKGNILQEIRAAGKNCAATGNLIKTTGIQEKELKSVIRTLVDEKAVVVIGNHYITVEEFENCRKILVDLIQSRGFATVPDFKNNADIGRNTAVEILEKFDSIGFTRRYPDGRKLVSAGSAADKIR